MLSSDDVETGRKRKGQRRKEQQNHNRRVAIVSCYQCEDYRKQYHHSIMSLPHFLLPNHQIHFGYQNIRDYMENQKTKLVSRNGV